MKVCETFSSIQGESSYAGLPCFFVRLAHCNLRCVYCDTRYSYDEGTEMSVEEVLAEAERAGIRLVEVTGGEPLLQQDALALVKTLLDHGHQVLVETNGSVSLGNLDPRAVAILDIKTPGSGMSAHNDLSNLAFLKPLHELKFVLCGREDYEWAKRFVEEHGLVGICTILFSAAGGLLDPAELVKWILEDRLPVRLNVQIQKYLFGPDARRV